MVKKLGQRLWLFCVFVFLYAPIFVLIVYSFTSSTMIGAIRGFSLEHYVTLFTTKELLHMIGGTLLLAVTVAFLSTLLGTIGAIGSFYAGKKSGQCINFLNQIPIANAEVVTGFSICVLMIVLFGVDKDTYLPLLVGQTEYLDEGGWDEDETIDLDEKTKILGRENMVDDFESWYEKTYGEKVRVEYSTFGTNEDLYNQMTLGDTFDLVCPSEYMIMKLMKEKKLEPFSEDFFDASKKENYYSRGVSPYIKNVFDDLKISGESLSRYGAGYMWGVMGLVYNPSAVSKEDVRHWSVLLDEKYRKQVTMKDSVRDSYLVALTILKEKKLLSEEFQKAMETTHCLTDELNDTSEQTVTKVQTILEKMRKNSYSLETDSGKADMVTGKVVLNMQWSGDGVYTMDEAEKDGLELSYAVPEEGSNLWFDGFCMMKNGISGDAKKKQAAQAFINYISRPDNVIRNMYYVGYTSVIAGGDSDLIFKYADWCYGAEEDEEEVSPYDLSYFFSGAKETPNKYVLEVPKPQASRQVSAQYPEQSVLKRSAVMQCFSEEANRRISRMWIRVRCF